MFKKYGLKSCTGSLVGSFNSIPDFYAEMSNQFRNVACEDIEAGEEGCVLYFVRNPLGANEVLANGNAALFGSGELAYS